MNRKTILVCLLALLALSATMVAAQDPVTIRMGTWAGVDEAAELNALIEEINASQSDFQIIQEPTPADYYTQIQTQLAGGTAAAAFHVQIALGIFVWLGLYLREGRLRELIPLRKP